MELVTTVWISGGRYYEKRASLRHYLYCIAFKVLTDHRRTRARRITLVSSQAVGSQRDLPDDSPGPETVEIRRSHAKLVRGCIEQINEAYRDVVRLSLDGLDSIQIAAKLGLPYNTTRSRLARGREQLKAAVRSRLAMAPESG